MDDGAAGQLSGGDLTVAGLWRWLLEADVSAPGVAAGLLEWAPDVAP